MMERSPQQVANNLSEEEQEFQHNVNIRMLRESGLENKEQGVRFWRSLEAVLGILDFPKSC